jgi:hypothetical protein
MTSAGNSSVTYTMQGYGAMPMGSAPPQQHMSQQQQQVMPQQGAQPQQQGQQGQQGYAQAPMIAGSWAAPPQGGMVYMSAGAPGQMVAVPAMMPQVAYAPGMPQQQQPQQQQQAQPAQAHAQSAQQPGKYYYFRRLHASLF